MKLTIILISACVLFSALRRDDDYDRIFAQQQQNTGEGQNGEIPKMHALDITRLYVRYGYRGVMPKSCVPGYFDEKTLAFYQWKGVEVPTQLVPGQGPFARIPPINLDTKGLFVILCEPPIRLVRVRAGQIIIGCYDRTTGTLLHWRNISFDVKNLPQLSDLDHTVMDGSHLNIVDITPPPADAVP